VPVTPAVNKLFSKFEHCMVFRFELMVSMGRTDGQTNRWTEFWHVMCNPMEGLHNDDDDDDDDDDSNNEK